MTKRKKKNKTNENKRAKEEKKYIYTYIRGMLSALQQKEAVLIAFRISKLRELKTLGPWKSDLGPLQRKSVIRERQT